MSQLELKLMELVDEWEDKIFFGSGDYYNGKEAGYWACAEALKALLENYAETTE